MTLCLTIPCPRESGPGIDYCCIGCSRSVLGAEVTHSPRCEQRQLTPEERS